MVMTAEQLRSKGLSVSNIDPLAQRLQARKQREVRRKQEQVQKQVQTSQQQKTKLGGIIQSLTQEIKKLEVQERTAPGARANEASARKYGIQAQLGELRGYYSQIENGGYYSNFDNLLQSASQTAKQVSQSQQAQFNVAQQIRKSPSINLPEGAKIISREGGTITYSLPSQTQQPIISQVSEVRQTPQGKSDIQGPVPQGGNIETFRETGKTTVTTQPRNSIIQKIFAKKPDSDSLGQIYVTPSEVSRPDVGGRYVTVPEKTVNVLTPSGTQTVSTGTTTVQDVISQIKSGQRYEVQVPKVQEVYNPKTQTFQSNVYGTGEGGTAFERVPTPTEQRAIQEAYDKEKRVAQKALGLVERGVGRLGPVLDTPVSDVVKSPIPDFSISRKVLPPPEITIGQSLTYPAKAIEFTAKTSAQGWEDIYGSALKRIPKKNWPGKWIGGEFEVKPKKGTQAWADAIDAGKVIPLTKEKFGKGIEKAIEVGTYAVPGVGEVYMGSQFFKGAETIRNPETEAKRLFEEQVWKPYQEQYAEAQKNLKEGEELESKLTRKELEGEYLPGIINQVKTGGAIEAGTSLAFLGVAGGVRGVKWIKEPIIKEVPEGFKVTSRGKEFTGKLTDTQKGRYFISEEIKAPGTFKASETVGFEQGDNILFSKQKLSQFGAPGKRTIVKEFKNGQEVILYQGNPFVDMAAYKSQREFLSPLVGEKGAKGVLRYTAPKLEEQFIKSGKIKLKGEKAEGVFKFSSEKPARVLDEALGIKTRGGKSQFETKYFARKGKGGNKVFVAVEDSKSIVTRTPPKKNSLDLVGFNFQEGISMGASSGSKQFFKGSDVGIEQIGSVSFTRNLPRGFDNKFFIDSSKTTILKPLASGERITFIEGTGAKSSPEYLQSLYTPLKQAPKSSFEIKPQKLPGTSKGTKTPELIPNPQKALDVPRIVRSEGQVSSQYAGTGLYERTEPEAVFQEQVIKPVLTPFESGMQVPSVKPTFFERTSSGVSAGNRINYGLRSVNIPRFEEPTVLKESAVPRFVSPQREVPREAFKVNPLLKQPQVPRQRLSLSQASLQPQRVSPRVSSPRVFPPRQAPKIKPRVRPPIPKLDFGKAPPLVLRKSKQKEVPQGYTFEVRRKRKWKKYVSPFAFATKAGAEAIAQKKVLSEAAASYRVVPAKKGKKILKTNLKVNPYQDVLFRKGKEPGVKVQKKTLRILSPGEKKEISYAGGLARMKNSQSNLVPNVKKNSKTKKSKSKGGKKMAKKKKVRKKKKK